MLPVARLVDLVGALARPLAAGAGAPVAFSLSATFAHERPKLAGVCLTLCGRNDWFLVVFAHGSNAGLRALGVLLVVLAGCTDATPTPTAADIPDEPEAPPNTTTPLDDPIKPDEPQPPPELPPPA